MSINSVYECFPNAENESYESRNVLVYVAGAGWVIGFYCHEEEIWFSYPEGVEMFNVTHWEELPGVPS